MDMMSLPQKQRLKQEVQEEKQSVIHKIQPIHGAQSLVIVLPKKLCGELGIRRGDYARFSISNGRLIMEKVQD